jgi:AraC-like DNA-binding protein
MGRLALNCHAMSQNRQSKLAPKSSSKGLGVADEDIIVRSLGLSLPRGQRIDKHRHDWHQLVYVAGGAMRVDTPMGSWVVPPDRAAWIPAGFEHAIQMTGAVTMRTVYLRPDLSERLLQACRVIQVSPLLRELVLETLQRGMLLLTIAEEARLAGVLADQTLGTHEALLQIKLPKDPRARTVAARAQADLSHVIPAGELIQGCGASMRTIERLFVEETGLTLGRWLQRARALHAIERLAAGDSVTSAGLAVGYDSTSAFIALFKRVLGRTPGSYHRDSTRELAG